ncbi:MAG: tyrosine-type recombinase/integrase [Candidatus Dormibacteria bacterium]
MLLTWAEREAITDASQLDRDAVRRLSIELQERNPPLRRASVRAYLKAVNVFLAWWEEESGVPTSPAPLPKLRRRERDVLSSEELDRIEAAAPTERDRLIIRIMADTGARAGEIAALQMADLVTREGRGYLALRGKTGGRHAPVAPAVFRRLRLYAEKTRPRDAASDRLFLALRRAQGEYQPLTVAGVSQVVHDAALRAEVSRSVRAHLLRHSAITRMVARGLSPFVIADICGVSLQVIHSNYLHLSDAQRYDAALKALRATPD